jgi:hypothetical protein
LPEANINYVSASLNVHYKKRWCFFFLKDGNILLSGKPTKKLKIFARFFACGLFMFPLTVKQFSQVLCTWFESTVQYPTMLLVKNWNHTCTRMENYLAKLCERDWGDLQKTTHVWLQRLLPDHHSRLFSVQCRNYDL